jgi:phytoene dehydrogenase-like protein
MVQGEFQDYQEKATTLAQTGCSVLLIEANSEVGGSCRSAELTLPGFVHDVCSAVHPLAIGSPFFRSLSLERYGLEWMQPELPLAHPLDEKCVSLHRPLAAQARELGEDGPGPAAESFFMRSFHPLTLVLAAWRAALDRSPADRFLALRRVRREIALDVAARCPSRRRVAAEVRERLREVEPLPCAPFW